MLAAGTLRHRVRIQQRSPGGTFGHPSKTWNDIATVWANIRYGTGSEAIRAGQIASLVQVSIRIRWRPGICATMRVLHGEASYEILSVLPDMSRQHIDLVCKVLT